MVAVKSHQAEAFLKAPDPRLKMFLFFGSDAGLVAERAGRLAASEAAREPAPGEILRLDDQDLEDDTGRLGVELRTIPMFGGRKIVRATTGRRINTLLLKPLIEEAQSLEGVLIVEAGNLKSDDSLRGQFEKSPHAAAIACYGDETRDLEEVVRTALHEAGRTISTDARQLLVSKLGADRAMTRGELEKLVLYTAGAREITAEDVEAVVGDASELAMDRILNAAASGEGSRAVAECARAISSGDSAQAIILATQRHFDRLHRLSAAAGQGASVEEALNRFRPPIFYKQKPALARQVGMWRLDRLARAQSEIRQAAKAARLNGALEDTIAERLLLRLAHLARADRRN